ncbi:MAG: aconitase X [Candidatus Helarchaeota archaeon]
MLSKLMKLLVKLGDSFGADRLIEICSAHTVLNFGLNIVNAAASILRDVANAGLKVKVKTTADPIIDFDQADKLTYLKGLYGLQDQLLNDLSRIGVRGFTCTPYFLDNRPNFGSHCAWSESSAVIYLNSVLGARSNREGGVVDIASAILAKTPNYGLHVKENRKGQVLFKIPKKKWSMFDLTSIGLFMGETAGSRIPVIEGLKGITNDGIKNLGAASAATGAVALIHVIGATPEAKTKQEAFQNDIPEETIEIDTNSLDEVRNKYSATWKENPLSIAIGCPHLSEDEVIDVLNRLKGKKVLEDRDLWICCCEEVRNSIIHSNLYQIVKESGAHLVSFCPLLTGLPRPFITNSGKTCFYSSATYAKLDECIKMATGEK